MWKILLWVVRCATIIWELSRIRQSTFWKWNSFGFYIIRTNTSAHWISHKDFISIQKWWVSKHTKPNLLKLISKSENSKTVKSNQKIVFVIVYSTLLIVFAFSRYDDPRKLFPLTKTIQLNIRKYLPCEFRIFISQISTNGILLLEQDEKLSIGMLGKKNNRGFLDLIPISCGQFSIFNFFASSKQWKIRQSGGWKRTQPMIIELSLCCESSGNYISVLYKLTSLRDVLCLFFGIFFIFCFPRKRMITEEKKLKVCFVSFCKCWHKIVQYLYSERKKSWVS